MAKNYVQYGNRLKALWTDRVRKDYEKLPYFLIGKTIDKKEVSQEVVQEIVELKVEDVVSELLEITEDNKFINRKNINNFAGSDNFKIKKTTSHISPSFLPLHNQPSSDEEDN